LDVGTGTGIFAEAFQAEGLKVSAIDVNPTLLEKAQSQLPSVAFKIGQAEDIPFADDSFDLVFLGHVLHETDDPLKALKEAKRVAVGRVVVLEWPYRDEEHGPPIEHRLKPEVVSDMADRAGLVRFEHLPLNHMDLYRMSVTP
jgi:ubiquinone/menaquinone biosynthesis C-methylase UbiE